MPRSTGTISCGCSTIAEGSVIKFPVCNSQVPPESEHHASCREYFQGRPCCFWLCRDASRNMGLMSRSGAIIVFMMGNLARLARLYVLISLCFACGSDGATDPPPTGSGPQIDVRYLNTLTPSQQNAVSAAAGKWMHALSKNLGDFRFKSAAADCFPDEPALDETHHNLLLFVSVGEIDGPGGSFAFTSICGISSRDTLPVLSRIRLDRADLDSMEALGILQSVILHEMGHALGFNPGTYVGKGLSAVGTDEPVFPGTTARSEFPKHAASCNGITVSLA